jgi:hypothetical protein
MASDRFGSSAWWTGKDSLGVMLNEQAQNRQCRVSTGGHVQRQIAVRVAMLERARMAIDQKAHD